jgi:hypothetical protein
MQCLVVPHEPIDLNGNHRTGLNAMISGPFFIDSLVGVGCRLMVIGPGLGTLAGTP